MVGAFAAQMAGSETMKFVVDDRDKLAGGFLMTVC
jgi:hypothetical protein